MNITNLRPILWGALALVLFLNYQMWMRDFAPPPVAANATSAGAATDLDAAIPTAREGAVPAAAPVPGTAAPTASPTAAAPVAAPVAGAPATPAAAAPEADAGALTVRTDVLDLVIGLKGGELQRADLSQYPLVKEQPGVPVRLLRREGPDAMQVLQTGLAGDRAEAARPTHLAVWKSDFREFTLLDGVDTLKVPMTWESGDGVTVTKTFIFHRGSYRIDLEYSVTNGTETPWPAASYAQILHDKPPVERSYFNVSTYAFEGPAIYDGTKYRKLKITDSDDANLSLDITKGWFAGLQHHFVTAMVPPLDATYHYTLRARGHEYLATTMGPTQVVAPNTTVTFKETLFVGPKLQAQLDPIHPELSRVADYGKLTILAKPLFLVLNQVHKMTGNWGVAIILTTFLLKLLFYPLSEASGKSMARMRTLGPRMKQVQETYKDDREKLGRAMMDLYKREKVNPAAGCLPLIIQFPVFIAFYWVLLESVEMRQAPFFGWIQDLSSQDPFYILPLIMAGAMFLQYRLQPTPADPVQAKVFMVLPIVMSITFAFFPAGLVLYWVTNTVLSIAQQWNINRRIEAASAARR
jgi:YidC/Oxa1 family membrane protein insertase